jgi:phosphoglycerate dehydrogenase-like enzyme
VRDRNPSSKLGGAARASAAQVVVSERLDAEAAEWLAGAADLRYVDHRDSAAMRDALREADGLIVRTYTQVDATLLEQAPRLRVVGRAGVGLDNIDVAACRARGVEVVYTPEANTQAVVEYVLALMLDALRPRTHMDRAPSPEEFGRLREAMIGSQLDRLSLGIVGLGRIGKRLGRVAHALGMNVLAADIAPAGPLLAEVNYPVRLSDHAELYARCDVISLHVDGRPANRGMIDAEALACFRPEAVFINAARGMLVDHRALAAWAASRPQARVVLDVHDPEPPTPDNPLLGLPNVRLLPHLASRTATATSNMSWVVSDVAAVLDGRPPSYPAPDVG